MRITALTSQNAALWFWAVDAVPSPEQAAQLAETLAGGPLRPNYRAIIERDGRIVGRFAAQRRDGAVHFWIPWFHRDASEAERKGAMRRVVDDLATRCAAEGPQALPLESRAGDDEAGCALWLDVLREAGFEEASVYRVHILTAPWPVAVSHAAPPIEIRAATAQDLERLPQLYCRAYADTLDRRQRAFDAAPKYIKELQSFGTGYDPALWLIAAVEGEPAGFALVNAAREEAFPGLSAWLLEIGCLPQYRGKRIAGMLLAAVLPRLTNAGVQRLLATIDEENTPSICLHDSFGFVKQKDRHYVFRLAR